MRKGKISENVLKRSVLKKIRTHRDEVTSGAGVGTDCAVLTFGEGYDTVISTTPVTAPTEDISTYAIPMSLNNIAAAGAEPVGVMLAVVLPEKTEESELQTMMERAEEVCRLNNVEIIGGHTEVLPAITEPIMTVTGVGKRRGRATDLLRGVKPGQDIVISKWIGIEGTIRLAKGRRKELCMRYPAAMIEKAVSYDRYLSVIPEAATAVKSGVCAMHDVSEGGIFGALWELAEGAGVGLTIDLKKLPLRQETVEVCEYCNVNPYELLSGGCLLMTSEDGATLVSALEAEGIPAVAVGKVTDSKDRILINEEEIRYMDRPKRDGIYGI